MPVAVVFSQLVLLPVNLMMAWLYWRMVGTRWPAADRRFDALVLLFAGGAWVLAAIWGFGSTPPGAGRIWPFVLSALGGYVAFTGVLWLGFLLHLFWPSRSKSG